MTPYRFFLKHAGYSFDPNHESQADGRKRTAKALAEAEEKGRDAGLSFEWRVDDVDSSEWSDEEPAYDQWVCVCRDEDGDFRIDLGCIDFGRGGKPWGSPYRRVVEAELAREVLP